VPNSRLLTFECTNGKESAKIGVDTGSSEGVWLNPKRWQQWCAAHEGLPRTICVGYMLADGLLVYEMQRAKKITIGGLTLRDVPVSMTSPSADILFEHSDAILGPYVLRQLKLIVDAKNGVLYTCPISHPVGQYEYNLLGAVFVPKDLEKSDDLVAHVIRDGPAYRAGIRDGDVLLKIGILNVTVWRTDPSILPLSRFWSQPVGTKHKLTLKRADKQYETTVALEELPAVD
jgi:PDZ domain/Aspartyl protease